MVLEGAEPLNRTRTVPEPNWQRQPIPPQKANKNVRTQLAAPTHTLKRANPSQTSCAFLEPPRLRGAAGGKRIDLDFEKHPMTLIKGDWFIDHLGIHLVFTARALFRCSPPKRDKQPSPLFNWQCQTITLYNGYSTKYKAAKQRL